MSNSGSEIRARLTEIRLRHFGQRGKAEFARLLGIRPSTYGHYERDRTPPANLLVRAAEVTGVDLLWLLTGLETGSHAPGPLSPPVEEELFSRIRQLLSNRPDLKAGIVGYLDLLEEVAEKLPAKSPSPVGPLMASAGEKRLWSAGQLVPVVGRTAAGPAHFWREIDHATDGPELDARLEVLLRDVSERSVQPAKVSGSNIDESAPEVSLIQFANPDSQGLLEFLVAPDVKRGYPDAVAWRIDGDSMAPRYRDGDLVITSRQQPAVQDQPCVARLKDQIGVSCKLFHETDRELVLIPVNEHFAPQRFSSGDLQWALRVLYSLRLE